MAEAAGDVVANGDAIAEVETDKAIMEVEAFHDGYLVGPLAAEGSELAVGATIGYIADSPGASAVPVPSAASSPRAAPSATPQSVPGARPSAPSSVSLRAPGPSTAPRTEPARDGLRISPYARRLAQQMGVDVARIAADQGHVQAPAC